MSIHQIQNRVAREPFKMNVCDIRPFSTYIGRGGTSKKIKKISMKVDGSLSVEWRRVAGNSNNRGLPLNGAESIEQFASWAKLLVDTWSSDLAHHVFDSAGAPQNPRTNDRDERANLAQ